MYRTLWGLFWKRGASRSVVSHNYNSWIIINHRARKRGHLSLSERNSFDVFRTGRAIPQDRIRHYRHDSDQGNGGEYRGFRRIETKPINNRHAINKVLIL